MQVLIGIDVSKAHCPLEVLRGKRGDPYAVRGILGWTIYGRLVHIHPNISSKNFYDAKSFYNTINIHSIQASVSQIGERTVRDETQEDSETASMLIEKKEERSQADQGLSGEKLNKQVALLIRSCERIEMDKKSNKQAAVLIPPCGRIEMDEKSNKQAVVLICPCERINMPAGQTEVQKYPYELL